MIRARDFLVRRVLPLVAASGGGVWWGAPGYYGGYREICPSRAG
jgi:hypothetical protein